MYTRELPGLLDKAMEGISRTPKGYRFNDESRKLISDMAEYALAAPTYDLFKDNIIRIRKANPDASAADIYLYLLERIVSSPSPAFRQYIVLLIIPWLDERLKIEGAESVLHNIQISSVDDLVKFLRTCEDKVMVTVKVVADKEGAADNGEESGTESDK